MRYVSVGLLVGLVGGCCSHPCNTVGWQFTVGKAPMMFAPAIVSTSAPMHAISGLAAAPAAPATMPTMPARMAAPPPPPATCGAEPLPAPRRMGMSAVECTLENACQRIEQLERRLGAATPPRKLGPAAD